MSGSELRDRLPAGFRSLVDEHDLLAVVELFCAGYSEQQARAYLDDNRAARERVMLHEAGCLYR